MDHALIDHSPAATSAPEGPADQAAFSCHGDPVIYISPSRGTAWIVSGYEDLLGVHTVDLGSHRDADDGSDVPASPPRVWRTPSNSRPRRNSPRFCTSSNPARVTNCTFVNADCQRRSTPCDKSTRDHTYGNFHKDELIPQRFGRCERIDDSSSKCTETYDVVCRRKYYDDKDCTTPSTPSPVDRVID
jgi:hypothetical protein